MSICAAIGIAAGMSAAALGLGYGLGVIGWVPVAQPASSGPTWYASLAWVIWLAATATVIGALAAGRVDRVGGRPTRSRHDAAPGAWDAVWLVIIILAVGIGAMINVPLVALPARAALLTDNAAPQFTAGGYALTGVIIGLLVAVAALTVPAVAANVILSAAYIGVMALVAAVHSLRAGAGPVGAQLGTWRPSGEGAPRSMVDLPTAAALVALALVIGALAAWPGARRGDHRVGVAVSGATGPLLVAVAYFLTTPGMGERSMQLSGYVVAPYAVLAGVAGSALVSAIGPTGARRTGTGRARRAATAERDGAPGPAAWPPRDPAAAPAGPVPEPGAQPWAAQPAPERAETTDRLPG